MFTGIIEEKGKLLAKHLQGTSSYIRVGAHKVLEGTNIGDSIAVNGVCLTVTSMDDTSFTADVMPETLNRTGLGSLKTMEHVNLERAMAADGRFGGHIVSGHIDGTGRIVSLIRDGIAIRVTIEASEDILNLIIEKGSICIDGISLTVTDVGSKTFSVSVIPHTGFQTTLLDKKKGDIVNLENDVIGKYVMKLLGMTGSHVKENRSDLKTEGLTGSSHNTNTLSHSGITMDFLEEHGF